MKNKKILFILIFAIFIILGFTTKSNASLYLDNLDFYAEIDKNGNMNVTETWNIDVSNTNTLYKTFELDSNKYSNITNVKVSEVGKGNFTKTNTWAYHLTKNYYFGGINNEGDFEIAWGVGLDNSSATKIYKISYTVVDAIAKYNDCTEMYWQFLGDDFEISADKITGTIKLPSKANSKEDIRVWGHVATLNGEIYATSEDTVEFSLDNYSGGNYVEVRIATPTEIFGTVSRTYNKDMLSNITEEETKWANIANVKRNIVWIFFIIIAVLIMKKTVKYIKILKNTKKIIPTEQFEYFREKPNKDSTPADALFLYNRGDILGSTSFSDIFSATLLNLSLKGYFNIAVEENEKEEIVIYKTQKDIETLKYEEEKIGSFIRLAIGEKEKITIKELQHFIKGVPIGVSRLIEDTAISTENKNKKLNNFDEEKSNEKSKYTLLIAMYICSLAFILPVSVILKTKAIWIILIILIINAILTILIRRNLSNLTQKGIDEREKWKGLKRYMEDFSLLDEKEIPALEVWEEYLVYATVFGIADKVIKQLKLVYPQIEQMNDFNTASYVYMMNSTNFNSSFNRAINSSIASARSAANAMSSSNSSGSGGGGGFSGGGGGGRRPVEADGGR